MAVEITVDFTDEQWDLIKEYMLCYVLQYDEDGNVLGNEGLSPTVELMAHQFKREVKEKVNGAHKRKIVRATGEIPDEIFTL